MEQKTIEFIYNDPEDLIEFKKVIEGYNFNVILYNENESKSYKKIIALEHQFSTKLKPLIIISLKKKILKVFYQERDIHDKYHKTSIEKLDLYLKHLKPVDDSFYLNFIESCKTNNISKQEVLYYLDKLFKND